MFLTDMDSFTVLRYSRQVFTEAVIMQHGRPVPALKLSEQQKIVVSLQKCQLSTQTADNCMWEIYTVLLDFWILHHLRKQFYHDDPTIFWRSYSYWLAQKLLPSLFHVTSSCPQACSLSPDLFAVSGMSNYFLNYLYNFIRLICFYTPMTFYHMWHQIHYYIMSHLLNI